MSRTSSSSAHRPAARAHLEVRITRSSSGPRVLLAAAMGSRWASRGAAVPLPGAPAASVCPEPDVAEYRRLVKTGTRCGRSSQHSSTPALRAIADAGDRLSSDSGFPAAGTRGLFSSTVAVSRCRHLRGQVRVPTQPRTGSGNGVDVYMDKIEPGWRRQAR